MTIATQAIALSVETAPLTITETTVPNATNGAAYDHYLHATGGVAPYTWSISAGALPAGITLATVGDAGHLSGVPTVSGTFNFTAQVTDSAV